MAQKASALCRLFLPGDEAGILTLYKTVFGLDMTLEAWWWFYQAMPGGPAIIAVAENEAGIVGHYAVQPRPFWVNGVPRLGGLAIGTMIDPAMRSVSLLVELAQTAYRSCREHRIDFLYAFPNEQAYQVRRMLLGWQPLPPLVEWQGSLADWPSVSWPGVRTRLCSPQNPPLLLPDTAAGSQAIAARWTTDWLRWRFDEKPSAEYALHVVEGMTGPLGCAVTKRYVRDGTVYGHVVDWQLLAPEREIGLQLIGAMGLHFAAWSVEKVSCWCAPGSTFSPYLEDLKMSHDGRSTHFIYLSLAPALDPVLCQADAWNVQMGDSDVY